MKKQPVKRPRDSESEPAAAEGEASSPNLSDDKKNEIEAKRQAALAKRAKSQSPQAAGAGDSTFADLIDPSWHTALKGEFTKPYFTKLEKFVNGERAKHPQTIFPVKEAVFSAFEYCPLDTVKVVILGQDPYHGPRQAHGLCFSIEDAKGCKFPPSLRNIFKELDEDDATNFTMPSPLHGNLSAWAKQGVLLLNTVLTVQSGKANSHAKQGWEKFTEAVVSAVNRNQQDVVFLLWGSPAAKKGEKISTAKHHILKSVHPSPLSAHRGWFGCKHFSQCNEFLESKGKTPIDWQV